LVIDFDPQFFQLVAEVILYPLALGNVLQDAFVVKQYAVVVHHSAAVFSHPDNAAIAAVDAVIKPDHLAMFLLLGGEGFFVLGVNVDLGPIDRGSVTS
jgi:hypothetical protein